MGMKNLRFKGLTCVYIMENDSNAIGKTAALDVLIQLHGVVFQLAFGGNAILHILSQGIRRISLFRAIIIGGSNELVIIIKKPDAGANQPIHRNIHTPKA